MSGVFRLLLVRRNSTSQLVESALASRNPRLLVWVRLADLQRKSALWYNDLVGQRGVVKSSLW